MMSSLSSVFFGVEIPETLLAGEMQNHKSGALKKSRQMAGRALAAKAVLLARGEALGLTPNQDVNEQGMQETVEEALIRAVLDEEVDVNEIDPNAARKIYDSQPTGFSTAPLLEASHILIAPREDDETSWNAAEDQANEILELLQANPRKFFSLARTVSSCPSGSDGGSLGQLRPGDLLKSIWDVLLTLEPEQISDVPIKSKHGWHVLKLDHRVDGRRLPFEHVRDHIETQLEMRAWTLAAARYVDRLLEENTQQVPILAMNELGQLDPQGEGASKINTVLGDVFSRPGSAHGILNDESRSILNDVALEANSSAIELLEALVPQFLIHADDQAWTKIITCLRESENPLPDCLGVIVKHQYPPEKKPGRVLDIGANRMQKPPQEKCHDHCC